MNLRAAAVLVAAGLIFTGCSSESGTTGTAPTSPSVSSTEPPEETETERASVEVPDVIGMDGASALAELENVGLGAAASWQNAEVAPDGELDVVTQEPRAGETLLSGDDVVLVMGTPVRPETVVLQTGDSYEVWVGAAVDERQVGWIVTDLMNPDRTPYHLDVVEPDRAAGTYSVVVRCEMAPSPEESILAEATFTVDDGAPTAGRQTADTLTMVDENSCA